MPFPHPFCGVWKIKDGVEVLAVADAPISSFETTLIACVFLVLYIPLILWQLWHAASPSCEKLQGCVIDAVVLVSILIGCIFNKVLQCMLVAGVRDLEKHVNYCRVWLRLRFITLPSMYISMFYLCRGFGDAAVRAKFLIFLIVISAIPIVVHIWTWYAILAYTHEFRVRRQMERPAPPPKVEAPRPKVMERPNSRSTLMNLKPKPPTASSSTLDNTSSADANNNNIV